MEFLSQQGPLLFSAVWAELQRSAAVSVQMLLLFGGDSRARRLHRDEGAEGGDRGGGGG